MNTNPDTRRAPRRNVPHPVMVVDTMTGEVVGQLSNISESGMLLVASTPLVEDALYQLQFRLGGKQGHERPIEVGAHVQWTGPANTPKQAWVGLRFLTLDTADHAALQAWLSMPGNG